MDITFGKYKGQSLEMLLLKHPDYIHWMLSQEDAYGAMKQAQDAAGTSIEIFDHKPFTVGCHHQGCTHQVTRCSVYLGDISDPYWWCDDHEPHESGANPYKLHTISTYMQALNYVQTFSTRRVSDYKSIIKDMAQAKGLPNRVGEKQAKEFFS